MADNIFSALLASGFPVAIRLCGDVMVPETNAGASAIHQPASEHQNAPRPLNQYGFGRGTDAARAYWSWLNSDGRQAEGQFLTLDLLFALLYGGALAGSLFWVWVALDQPFHPGWIFAPLLMITLADCLENLVQFTQLHLDMSSGQRDNQSLWIRLSSCSTIIKRWLTSGLYVSVAGIMLNMLFTFWDRRLATDAAD